MTICMHPVAFVIGMHLKFQFLCPWVIGIDYFDPVFSLMCFIGLNGEKGEKESGS